MAKLINKGNNWQRDKGILGSDRGIAIILEYQDIEE